MLKWNYFFTISCLLNISYLFGQHGDTLEIDSSSHFRYAINNIDTTLQNCDSGNQFDHSNSIIISAQIIFQGLPSIIDTAEIFRETKRIIKAKGISRSTVLRTLESETGIMALFYYQKDTRSKTLSKNYLGEVSILGEEIFNSLASREIDYSCMEYALYKTDSSYVTCTNGLEYDDPNFKIWDSLNVFTNIIFPQLPVEYDTQALYQKALQIMKSNKIHHAYIWRDKETIRYMIRSYMPQNVREKWEQDFVGSIKGYSGKLKTLNDQMEQ